MVSTINEMISDNNQMLTNSEGIVSEAAYFYHKLFTKDKDVSSTDFYNRLNEQQNKLSWEQQLCCEGMLTLEECSEALQSFPFRSVE